MSFRVLTEQGEPPLMESQVGQTDDSKSFNFRCPVCGAHVINGIKSCPGCGQMLNWK